MTLRQRIVFAAMACVAIPLVLAALVAIPVAGHDVTRRAYERLDDAAAGARSAIELRLAEQDNALAGAAASVAAGASAGAASAAGAPGALLQTTSADVLAVVGPPAAPGRTAPVVDVAARPGAATPAELQALAAGPARGFLRSEVPVPGTAMRLVGAVRVDHVLASLGAGAGVGGSAVAFDVVDVAVGPWSQAQLRPGFRHAQTGGSAASLMSSVELPGAAGTLQARTPLAPVSSEQHRLAVTIMFGAIGLVAIVVAASDRLVGRAVRPLERLVEVVDTLAAGTLDAIDRTTPRADDGELADVPETQTVARAIDRVAAALRDRSQELEDTRERFRLSLVRLGDVLSSTHDYEGIVDAIVDTSLLAVPADAAVFYRFIGVPGRLQAVEARGVNGYRQIILDGSGLAGLAALTQQATNLVDPELLDDAEPRGDAGVAIPVHVLGRVVGVLAAYGTALDRAFTPEEVKSLQTIVRQAEIALANIELHAQAQRDALTDGLTGLANRRQFDLRCRDAQQSAVRFGEPYAIAIFDLDDFKRVNDDYDHLTGDAALVHVARLLHRASREVDVVARWGGEEFALLIQRSSVEEAVAVAERVRRALVDDPLHHDGRLVRFTVSAGVASYPRDGSTATDVIAAADAALLRAKTTGKNRVQQASGPTGPMATVRALRAGRAPSDATA